MRTTGTVEVTDADDPRLGDYRDLTDAAARRTTDGIGGQGFFVVEGVLALEQLLASSYPVRSILLTPPRAATLTELVSRVPDTVPVIVADRTLLTGVTGFDVHRGVLVSAQRLPLPDPERVLADHRRVVVVSAISDNENLGAIFRTAAALGIGAVLLDDRCADPLYRRSVRVSLGHVLHVPHARIGPLPAAFTTIRAGGHRVAALTPRVGSVSVDQAVDDGHFDHRFALVVGAEGSGLDPDVIDSADVSVTIPMAPGVDSLNVATSLGVVAAFAAARRGWND